MCDCISGHYIWWLCMMIIVYRHSASYCDSFFDRIIMIEKLIVILLTRRIVFMTIFINIRSLSIFIWGNQLELCAATRNLRLLSSHQASHMTKKCQHPLYIGNKQTKIQISQTNNSNKPQFSCTNFGTLI